MPLNMSFSFNYIFLVIMFWPIFFGMIGSQFVDVSLNCELWATFQFISILSILNNLLPLYQKFCNIIRFDEWCTCKNKCWSFPVFEFKKRQRVEDQMAWHVKWEFLCRRSPPLLSHVILTFHSFISFSANSKKTIHSLNGFGKKAFFNLLFYQIV